MNTFLRLLALALVVGWYQLPVIKDRATTLQLHGMERYVQSGVEAAYEAIGAGPKALRQLAEQRKIALQARLLAKFEPVVVLPQPPVPMRPEEVPAPKSQPRVLATEVSKPITSKSVAQPASPSSGLPAASTSDSPPTRGLPPATASRVAAPEAATVRSPLAQPPASEPGTVLLVGDSVMGEIAYGMKRWSAKNKPWQVVDAHKVSSGLCNTGYYDWPTVFEALVEEHKPRVVAMMIGANDEQDIFIGRKRHAFGSADWVDSYASRISAILSSARKANAIVYWVMPPVMREAGVEKRMVTIRKVIRDTLAQHTVGAVLVDEGARFEDKDGRYAETALIGNKLRSLRAEDGVHLSTVGAQILVDALLKAAIVPTPTNPAPTPNPTAVEATSEPIAALD